MEEKRYQLGERQENGQYPVTIAQTEAGHIYRRHGSWYAVMPGKPESRHPDRYAAADALVALVDAGHAPQSPASVLRTPYAHEMALLLHPDLRLTAANVVRAAEATARLNELGWMPLEGYPGADQPWLMQCLLCGWRGRRFWSHLRGRNGDPTPRPLSRHKGCIPISQHADEIKAVTVHAEECPCIFRHTTTVEKAVIHLKEIADAQKNGHRGKLFITLSRTLEPCPASSTRAAALRTALNKAQEDPS